MERKNNWCPCQICRERKRLVDRTNMPTWVTGICFGIGFLAANPILLAVGAVAMFRVYILMGAANRYTLKTYYDCLYNSPPHSLSNSPPRAVYVLRRFLNK